MNTSRRDFIKTLAAGSTASVLSMLNPIETVFHKKLDGKFNGGMLPTKADYSLDKNVTYLNHGSIGTIPKIVQQAHREYLSLCESNPWFYMWSGEWDEPIQKVRQKTADFLNADIDEISFPHNTTEIYNLLALGLPLQSSDEVLFCNLNHAGASIPFHIHSKKKGYNVKVFDIPTADLTSVTKQEILELYDQNINRNTKLIVIPHIDNTFGVRQPVKEIVALARSKGVEYISIDTAQTMGMLPIDVKDLDIDVIGTSAHKWIQAPKGISIAYFSKRIQAELDPMWVTWGQEDWKDSARKFEDYGTRNLPEVLTLGHSIDFQSRIDPNTKHQYLRELWSHAKKLTEENPKTIWRSPSDWQLSGSLFVVEIKDTKTSELAKSLFKKHGFVFRPFDAHSTIRISPNLFNTVEELDELFSLIV
ncbi:MAG: aminotransferase class V-fold PLP-dependent enzyme [Balneola sp.]|nr:aminotransferase class V-fold PLP-dependent enzyme [Balneola sp.]MBO6650833.1 aminotransferase class V-fold PLP-dependent enzyme [Balneola sp.]MBO6710058.1 aminotransferase class V-fold PLP-dependent enzyme [Balneola sp.]MBO6798742.1 aminotransferase class V-fold PLP-dependent enzyme [Balneola sp.]MBO6869856.1 aminotransferase class V-fold PLP-dependent enzyme [Balneola sp.]